MTTRKLAELIEKARADHYLPALMDDIDVGDLAADSGRYVLLERGHHGETFASPHDSAADAADYTLNQEYAEDWSAEVLIDKQTGETLIPETIGWRVA